jgi:hypothetical protein
LKVGLELVAQTTLSLKLGTFFETWLSQVDGLIKRSLGRDEYHLDVRVERGNLIAATGRIHLCQVDTAAIGLGPIHASPCVTVTVDIPPGSPIFLNIRTNAFLELSALRSGCRFRLVTDRPLNGLAFSLENPDVLTELVGPGRFLMEFGRLLG